VLPTVVEPLHRFASAAHGSSRCALWAVAATEQIDIEPPAIALIGPPRHRRFRDALGTLEQLRPTPVSRSGSTSRDVLAVLGVADAEQLFEALEAVIATIPPRPARRGHAHRLRPRSWSDLRDLEFHGRELPRSKILEEVPEELRITPERDERLLAQARALAASDVVRLLDLVSAALEATANGAQARIQLRAGADQGHRPRDRFRRPRRLLARIERLEAALAGTGPAPPARATAARPRPLRRPRLQVTAARRGAAPPSDPVPDPKPEPPTPAPLLPLPSPDRPARAPDVAACWPAVIDVVRQDNEMLAALLADARPVALHNQDVTVAFPAGKAFLKRKAEQDDYRARPPRRCARSSGRCSYSATSCATRMSCPMRAPTASPHDDLVKRLVEEFDAQEVLDDDQGET